MDSQELLANLDYVLLCFYKIIKVNRFLYRFIMVLHLISSFSLTRSLLVPYAFVSIGSIYCIILSSFELEAILLISSLKLLCLSLLNLGCVCNINCFLWKLYHFLILSMLFCFFLDGLCYSQVELLLNSFYNFWI